MFIRTGPVCLAALLLLAHPLTAQTPTADSDTTEPQSRPENPEMEALVQAYRNGDFVTARAGLAQLAPDGTPNAKYRYGRILYEGLGGPQDLTGAAFWLQQAVDENHVEAATLLAQLYRDGKGVEADVSKYVSLLQRAATRGDRAAQYLLGIAYQTGDGVAQDDGAAFSWFLAASEQQHPQAQLALSRAYARGQGTAADPQKALDHMQAAAANGLPEAQFLLALNLDSQGPAAADDALTWFRRAAENGIPAALRILGTRYLTGNGVDKNIDEALRLLTRAADLGDAAAMSNLGYIFASGDGVEQDDATAFEWYSRSARGGLPRGMLALALFYERGRGTDINIQLAEKYYRAALAAGVSQAGVRLGQMALSGALDGRADNKDKAAWIAAAAREGDETAREWLEQQAETGLGAARIELAGLLLDDETTQARAAELLAKAAANGDQSAQFHLAELYAAGTGVAADPVLAYQWYNIAAATGLERAAEMREVIAQLMTPEQIAEAQSLSRAFFDSDAGGDAAPKAGE